MIPYCNFTGGGLHVIVMAPEDGEYAVILWGGAPGTIEGKPYTP